MAVETTPLSVLWGIDGLLLIPPGLTKATSATDSGGVDRDGAQLLDLESQLRREYTIWQRRKWPTQMQGKLDLEFLYFSGYVFQGVVSQRLIVKHMETR